jgi:hypothetical protein
MMHEPSGAPVTPSPPSASEVSVRLGMASRPQSAPRKPPRAPILDPWSDEGQLEDAHTARPVSKPGQYSYDPTEDDVITSAAPLEVMLAPKKKPPPPPVRARTLTPSNQPDGLAQIRAALAAQTGEETTPTPSAAPIASTPPHSASHSGGAAPPSSAHAPQGAVHPGTAAPPSSAHAPHSTGHVAKPPPPRRAESVANLEPVRIAPPAAVPSDIVTPKRDSAIPPRPKSEPPPPPKRDSAIPPRPKSEPPPKRDSAIPPAEAPKRPSQLPPADVVRAKSVPPPPGLPRPPALEAPQDETVRTPSVAPRAPTIPPAGLVPSVPPLYDRIEVFSDLPREVQRVLNQRGALITLTIEEEHQGFALAMVMSGQVAICATIVDAPAARLSEGGLACTFGVSDLNVGVRVVALSEETKLAVWSRGALEEILADCPWVLGDLALVGDKLMSLAGATMGPLGDLDEASRELTLSRLDIRHLEPGHTLVEKGGDNLGLQIVGLGGLEICEGDNVVGTLSSGDLVFPDLVLEGGEAPQQVRAGPQGATVLTAPRMVAVELFSMLPMLLELLRVA